jgi:hypothetical protein
VVPEVVASLVAEVVASLVAEVVASFVPEVVASFVPEVVASSLDEPSAAASLAGLPPSGAVMEAVPSPSIASLLTGEDAAPSLVDAGVCCDAPHPHTPASERTPMPSADLVRVTGR